MCRSSTRFVVLPVGILVGNGYVEVLSALLVASKEIGLEASADTATYVVRSRDQHAGRSHIIKIDNSSFERVEEFKYLGTTLTN
jgi:hypothetical protein